MAVQTDERPQTTPTPDAGSGAGTAAAPSDRRTLPKPSPRGITVAVVLGLFLAGGIWSVIDLRINVASLMDSWANTQNFMGRSLPLDFPAWEELLRGTLTTLSIVLLATLLAVLISIPCALMASRTTCRSAALRTSSRVFIVITRAIPELILALFFLRIYGFGAGAIAGILALGLHSVGMLGKMYADAIEDHDDGPRQAQETAGAKRIQQIFGSVMPGIMPAVIAHALHRFDINLRASVILGWVGVAGLGADLRAAQGVGNYPRLLALGLIVLLLCILVEIISGRLRMKLLGRAEPSRFGVLWAWQKLRSRWSGERLETRPSLGSRTIPPWDGARIARFSYIGLTLALILASFIYIEWSALLALVASWTDADVSSWEVFTGEFHVAAFFTGLVDLPEESQRWFPPHDGDIQSTIFAQILVTIQIALAATFLGALLALPVGALAARNVAPRPGLAQFFRMVIVITRGIPELILALLLIIIMGLGAVAGTLALALGAMGLLSKLVADSIEDTDVRVQDALVTGGAGRAQVFFAATMRQSAPAVVSHVLYQLDVNFRSATLLGIVGAGGIGYQLEMARRTLQWEVVTYILICVVAVVLLIEAVSVFMRRLMR